MNVQMLIINIGYVESSRSSSLILRHRIGFPSVQEAMEHFAKFLVGVYVRDNSCCIKNRDKKFCPECGSSTRRTKIDKDRVRDVFFEFCDETADSSGWYWEEIEESGWETGVFNPSDFQQKPFVIIESRGEDVFANAYFGEIKEGEFHSEIECRKSHDDIRVYK